MIQGPCPRPCSSGGPLADTIYTQIESSHGMSVPSRLEATLLVLLHVRHGDMVIIICRPDTHLPGVSSKLASRVLTYKNGTRHHSSSTI